MFDTGYANYSSGRKMGVTFRFHLSRSAPYQIAGPGGKTGGEGRNRTVSSPTTSLNILIYKGILKPILQGFKRFLTLHATYRP